MEPKDSKFVIGIWRITSEAERREIISQFVQEQVDSYTQYDFARFLRKKYHTPQILYSISPEAGMEQAY